MLTRRHFLASTLALPAALLAACSGDDGGDGVSVSTPTASATSAATQAPTVAATPTALSAVAACAVAMKAGDQTLFRLVDKQRGMSADFAPNDLVAVPDRLAVPGFAGQRMRRAAADALVTLLDAADKQGIELRVKSSYRSYGEQVNTFQYWVNLLGETQARRESAPPGHSEHQLGSVADVVSRSVNPPWDLITEFGDTREGKWLDAHAHEYGFAFSYPPDGEAITGYIYEPWHIRYLGTTCAQTWKQSGLVLIRFLEAVQAAS